LKGAALRWFMGLGVDSITSWDNMKQIFLENIKTIVEQETRERNSSKCPKRRKRIWRIMLNAFDIICRDLNTVIWIRIF
jgi:hypothetical protein